MQKLQMCCKCYTIFSEQNCTYMTIQDVRPLQLANIKSIVTINSTHSLEW